MSEPQEKIDISDLKETFLECPVCVEHFNQTDKRPRLLNSCLHAFCTECLHQLLIKEGKGQITCPLCRQVQKISGKVDTLPADPVRGKLVDYLQIKHKRKVLCSECEEGDAISRCQECQSYLCKECDYHHKRHRFTRDHKIISLDDVLQQPVQSLSNGHFCPIHPKHQLEFYCATEEQLCCVSCTVLDHKGHELLKLDEAAAQRKRETEERLKVVYRLSDDLKEARKLGNEQEKIIAKTDQLSLSHINSMFDNLKKVLEERRQELVADVNNKSKRLLSAVQKTSAAHDQTLAIIDSTDTYYTQAKEKADVVEILQAYPAIKRSFEALKEPDTLPGFDKAIADFTFSEYNSREMERLTAKFNSFIEPHDGGRYRSQPISKAATGGTKPESTMEFMTGIIISVKSDKFKAAQHFIGPNIVVQYCVAQVDPYRKGYTTISFRSIKDDKNIAETIQQRILGVIQEEMPVPESDWSRGDVAAADAMKGTDDIYIKYQEDRHVMLLFAEDWDKVSKAKKRVQLQFRQTKMSSRGRRKFAGSKPAPVEGNE